MTIAVQGAVGEAGTKATTTLSYAFNSLAVINGFSFGANSDGLYQINTTNQDAGADYTRSVTFCTTDFGDNNPTRVRFVYVGIDTDNIFTVSVKVDDQAWRNYSQTPPKTGLHRVRVPVGRNGEGRYWTVKVSSDYFFRIDEIKLLLYEQSTGKTGY